MIGERVDFNAVRHESLGNRLLPLLKTIPKEHWFEKDISGSLYTNKYTLVNFACMGENAQALKVLIEYGISCNNRVFFEKPDPICTALMYMSSGPLKVLLQYRFPFTTAAFSWRVSIWDLLLRTPDVVVQFCLAAPVKSPISCGRILLMHNSRPNARQKEYCPEELLLLEQGIHSCRLATIAFLRVKRAGNLWRWDKFLLMYIAHHVWATRSEEWLN